MKSLFSLSILFLLVLTPGVHAKDPGFTHSREEGEDATSTHYYFYRAGATISHVRWVWNGGAQNKPTAIDYVIEGGKLTITHKTGPRSTIAALVRGKNHNDLKATTKYSLLRRNSSERLDPEDGSKLTRKQMSDLDNLLSLLTSFPEAQAIEKKKAPKKPAAKAD